MTENSMSIPRQKNDKLINPISKHIGYQLQRVSSLIMLDLSTLLSTLALRPAEASALMIIGENPKITQTTLGRYLGMKRTNISPLLSKLESQHLVKRSTTHGRSPSLLLTKAGMSTMKKASTLFVRHDQHLFDQLTASEKNEVMESLISIRKLFPNPDTTSIIDPLKNFLGYQLRRVSAVIMADLCAEIATIGLRPNDASILTVVQANSNALQTDIGRCIGIKRTNLSPLISTLESRSLVTRSPNGRSYTIKLSNEGKKITKKLFNLFDNQEKNSFGHLNTKAKKLLIDIFINFHNQTSEAKLALEAS